MIARGFLAAELIGYLSFDLIARQATLVVCGRGGRPLREVPLIPVGVFGRLLIRLAIRLGRYRQPCRAIARDDCDERTFSVWMSGADQIIVSDEQGEHWLRSIDETTAAIRAASPLSSSDVSRLVHSLKEVSRN